jgi:hypothetical protein
MCHDGTGLRRERAATRDSQAYDGKAAAADGAGAAIGVQPDPPGTQQST